LAKWYADCVTADGVAFIGYSARTRLGPITVPYHSTLVSRPNAPSAVAFTLHPNPGPVLRGREVGWRAPHLDLAGTWTATAPAFRRVLHQDDRSLVDWHCHIPAGHATVRLGGAAPLAGEGYVEELVVAGDPRRLPIREVWWGRFAGNGHHLVWIVWRGPQPLALVLFDGQEQPHGRAGARGVTFTGGRLVCDDTRTLRSGRIGRTFLAAHRRIARLVPRALDLHEEKWLSRARLEGPDGRTATGWAIHEVIRWP
jgi:hypothetical protein